MKKSFLVASLILSLSVQSVSAAFNPGFGEIFSDVKDPHPYAYQIDWLADNGVVRGYEDGKFKPGNCVNRAEFLKMLYAARSIDVSSAKPNSTTIFSDIDLNAWYAPYLSYALQKEVVRGYPDKTFRPGQCVNRVEAVKMAVLEFHGGNTPAPWGSLQTNLIDVAGDAWYSPMMKYAHDAHVLGLAHMKVVSDTSVGTDAVDAKYFPDQGMTRGEVAYLLYMLKALKDNDVAAHDGSIWANGKKHVLYNEERGVLMPMRLADAYAFDDCGKVSRYANESWYQKFLTSLEAADVDLSKINDACYSMEGKVLVFLMNGGYGETFRVFKFDAVSSALSESTLDCKGVDCPADAPGFGKRTGNFITITGSFGDVGGGMQSQFEYYFGKNSLELKRTRSVSIHVKSGAMIYGPWKNY